MGPSFSLSLPFIVFWVLLFLGRGELGWKGVLISVVIWAGLLSGFAFLRASEFYFVGGQALVDVVLVLVIVKGDVRVR